MAYIDSVCPGCGVQNWTHTGLCTACSRHGMPLDDLAIERVLIAREDTANASAHRRMLSDADIAEIARAVLAAMKQQ